MQLRKLLLDWLTPAGFQDGCEHLHSVERMRAILDRERMRSDRSNSSFALLTLALDPRSPDGDLPVLGRTVAGRVRITDDAGLMGPHRVGIILPETPSAGAWKLAEDICELLPQDMYRPECDVYVYPSHPKRVDLADAATHGRSHAPATNGKPHQPLTNGQPVKPRTARPMEVLFAQPLPPWKRAIDLVGGSVALILAAPLMVLVAVAIKLTSRGPILFLQQRNAVGGQNFTMYKFRTMHLNAEQQQADLRRHSVQDGPAFKMPGDPRVTWLGRFLRSTSIDELPQLFNILQGDMSLVGPRPLPCEESDNCEPWQRRR